LLCLLCIHPDYIRLRTVIQHVENDRLLLSVRKLQVFNKTVSHPRVRIPNVFFGSRRSGTASTSKVKGHVSSPRFRLFRSVTQDLRRRKSAVARGHAERLVNWKMHEKEINSERGHVIKIFPFYICTDLSGSVPRVYLCHVGRTPKAKTTFIICSCIGRFLGFGLSFAFITD